jgi:hypothetical protein
MGNVIIHEFSVEPASEPPSSQERTGEQQKKIGAQEIARLARRLEERGLRIRAH